MVVFKVCYSRGKSSANICYEMHFCANKREAPATLTFHMVTLLSIAVFQSTAKRLLKECIQQPYAPPISPNTQAFHQRISTRCSCFCICITLLSSLPFTPSLVVNSLQQHSCHPVYLYYTEKLYWFSLITNGTHKQNFSYMCKTKRCFFCLPFLLCTVFYLL